MRPDDYSHIGRYGTISLIKRQDPNTVITAFGIDTNQLTFGRDPACGVRLYYADVSVVHCKIVFEDYKAFLVVLGAGGLLVDDCKVYPNNPESPGSPPTIVPLTNNSEFEIHGKRFRFTYPPKDLRPTLYASPAPNRTPRLSMIQSTKVFAPRPSPDPRENLRVLQTPLKNTFKSPLKNDLSSSPLRANLFGVPKQPYNTPDKREQSGQQSQEEEEEENIVLVEGNHPRVVEEDRDLIILEDIEVPSHPSPAAMMAPAPMSFETPVRKRSLSRNTLHRAVLIRSAQRAILKAEKEEQEKKQEEEEEMEVLDTVASIFDSDSEEEEGEENREYAAQEEEDVDEELEEVDEDQSGRLNWKKGLESLWPFRSSSPERPAKDKNTDENDQDPVEEEEEPERSAQDEEQDDRELPPHQTPVRRAFGQFMTPQVHPRSKVPSTGVFRQPMGGQSAVQPISQTPMRYSLGGEARRVARTDQIWKVRDIVIPETRSAAESKEDRAEGTPARPTITTSVSDSVLSSGVLSPRKMVSEEERKAIKERRRSALREVESFFPGGVPGIRSPAKPMGWSPMKTPAASEGAGFDSLSPKKLGEPSRSQEAKKTEDAMDTRSLFERMKETVEGMKRRRSLATPSTPQGQRASLGLGTRPTSPSKVNTVAMMEVAEEEDEGETDSDQHQEGDRVGESSAFALLRPGAGEESSKTKEIEGGHTSTIQPETANNETMIQQEANSSVPAENSSAEDTSHTKRKSRSKTPARRTRVEAAIDGVAKAKTPPIPESVMPAERRVRKVVEEPENSDPVATRVPVRRGRQMTASEAPNPAPPRRGRKAAADDTSRVPKDDITVDVEEDKQPAAEDKHASEDDRDPIVPKRGTRKTVNIASAPVEDAVEPLPRRGRIPRVAATARQTVAGKTGDDVSPTRDTRRAAKTKIVNDADPIDIVAIEEETIAAKPKGRKKATNKQEIPENKSETTTTATITAVATKTRTKATTTTKTNDSKTHTRTRKTPATAPPAIQQGVNKENTPGSEVSSAPDAEEPVKVRVSRTTKKAASGTAVTKSTRVKREESDDEIAVEPEAPRGRVMRATRARTRT